MIINKKDEVFLENYFSSFIDLLTISKKFKNKIIEVKKKLLNIKKRNKKVIIFGNGGSAAIASHFSVDLTKNAKIRSINFNESDLITCFSNDYGYENWIKKSIEYYYDKGDLIIAISSSGSSKNILNACKYAKEKKLNLITLTGKNINNPVSKLGNINFFIDSKSYNHIENCHQFILLCLVDLIIGKKNYPSNR